MFAIVSIAGQQIKVSKDQKVVTNRLVNEVGDSVVFDRVLLLEKDDKTQVGTPTVENAKVTAKILSHFKDEKILVFKKKRRKGYKKLRGHRQFLSKILIEDITC